MTPRIVSLLPAATEIVAALGAVDELVGVSHECDYPRPVQRLPRVTASAVDPHAASRAIDDEVRRLASAGLPVFTLDAGQLVSLAPTHVLTQALCEVCAVSDGDVRALGDVLQPPPRLVSLAATTLDGVWADVAAIAAAIGREREGSLLLDGIRGRVQLVHETLAAARAPRPRVAVIEWLAPPFAAGHWTPEVVRRAGGVDVLATPGTHSVRVEAGQVRDAAPDLLLFAPCGFDVERASREAGDLLRTEPWRWAAGVEAWALDGNALTSRPGPRLADAIEVIAAIIAPSSFAAPAWHYARRLTAPGGD